MPARPRSYAAVVKAAERALRAARVDHVFVGGIAVMAFGEPRTTRDVEVIAEYRWGDVPALVKAFRREGFRPSSADFRDSLSDGTHTTIPDARSEYHVDLKPAVRIAAVHAIADRVTVLWKGMSLPMAGPEHTIVMKLVYGSEQDLEDATRIYRRNRVRLDLVRMREFARQQGVGDALRVLEGETGPRKKRRAGRKRLD